MVSGKVYFTPKSAIVLGEQYLLLQCVEMLVENGCTALTLVTNNPTIVQWASQHGYATYSGFEALRNHQHVDAIFSITNLRLLPKWVLSLGDYGINFHDAPLPRYAGLHATSWAILNGESEHGVTWHAMDAEFDAGDILVQERFAIDSDDTAFSLSVKCQQHGLESFRTLLANLSTGKLESQAQIQHDRLAYLSYQRPRCTNLVDWRSDVHDIMRHIRAFDTNQEDRVWGFPVFSIERTFYLITGAVEREEPTTVKSAAPGTILACDAEGLVVACGQNALRIREVSRMDGEQVLLESLDVLGRTAGLYSEDQRTALRLHLEKSAREQVHWLNAWSVCEPYSLSGLGLVGTLPNTSARGLDRSIELEISEELCRAFSDFSRDSVFALCWCAFLLRLSDVEQVSVGFSANGSVLDELSQQLFMPFIPWTLQGDNQLSVQEFFVAALADLAALRNQMPPRRDFVISHQALNPLDFPFIVEVRDALEMDSVNTDYSGCAAVLRLQPDGLCAGLSFDSSRLNSEAIEALINQFDRFVSEITKDLTRSVAIIPMLAEDEQKQLLSDWNNTQKLFPEKACVHHLIEHTATQFPADTALVFRQHSLSYKELDEQANALAKVLLDQGVKPDDLVGIYQDRSIEMVVSMLAVHKSGAAYVPLDPLYPRDRVALMIEDSEVGIVLSQTRYLDEVPCAQAVTALCVDTLLPTLKPLSQAPTSEVTEANLAYVIYTSGSTGKPKGVMVEHRNVVNFISAMDDTLQFKGDRGVWLAVTSISFDISVLEIFWSLARGFKVVIQEDEHRIFDATASGQSKVKRDLDIGLFYFSSAAGPEVTGDRYRLLLEGAKFADQHDFSCVWTPERHFHPFGGVYPNPAVTSAAVAAITQRIAIRAGSCVLPLHSPVRVAEEWSVVDNLSNGRVGLSFASGWHANDFAIMPDNFSTRKQLMFDNIEVVKKLWRGETITLPNGNGDPFDAKIYPAPIQQEPQIWITTAGNVETFRQAGEAGHNILTNLLGQSIKDIDQKISAYREGRCAKGHKGPGNVTVMVHTFVGQDVEQVKKVVREPFCNYLKSSFDLVKIAPWAFPAFSQPSKAAAQDRSFDADNFTDEDMAALIDHAFERYFETAGIFGSPESCLPLIDQLKRVGVDELACLIDFGVEDDVVLTHLPYLDQLRQRCRMQLDDAEGTNFGLAQQIERHGVTHFQCTPSMARILVSDADIAAALKGLDKFLLGGEALPDDLAKTLVQNTQGDLINVYGPTETTIWSTSCKVSQDHKRITIGRPIANTQIYILDRAMNPVPIGVPGELYIGGRGVVRGYFKRPELSEERFVNNPFAEEFAHSPKMYRTGDLVRYQINGDIEFLGRIDHQVKVRGYRIELGEIEAKITELTGVKEAVVIAPVTDTAAQSLVAYVVPEPASDIGAAGQWQILWDQAYQGLIGDQDQAKADLSFDTSGWLNSFTGQPHEHAHMREWLDMTASRILALKPKRVLEIGCGTGMVLFAVAPHCEHYTGVDFSPSAIEQISKHAATLGLGERVTLIQGAADSFGVQDCFDLVIINSVAQYFPSANYLELVLDKALGLVNDRGNIFVGDVRHADLATAFYSEIETRQASSEMSDEALKQLITERAKQEGELLVSPEFFSAYREQNPRLVHVNAQLKRGGFVNEMSGYRYDVVLSVSASTSPNHTYEPVEFDAVLRAEGLFEQASEEQALHCLTDYLAKRQDACTLIRNIPNARLAAAHKTLMQIGAYSETHSTPALDPEKLYRLAERAMPSMAIELCWASSEPAGAIDLYAYPIGSGEQSKGALVDLPRATGPQNLQALCLEPQRQRDQQGMLSHIRTALQAQLPDFMQPDDFVFLTVLPLTPNGKIDRKALPLPKKREREAEIEYRAPKNELEQQISTVMQELLNLSKVGTQDNFFDLGINSLLIAQANNLINQRIEQHVSLVSMYRFPTVASLAAHISAESPHSDSSEKGLSRAEKRKAAQSGKRSARRVVRRRT